MDSDKRLIDYWLDSEEKKVEPRPDPVPGFNLARDDFFGYILYLFLLLFLVISSGCYYSSGAFGYNKDSYYIKRAYYDQVYENLNQRRNKYYNLEDIRRRYDIIPAFNPDKFNP